jgi:hypothetical protein
MEYTLLLQILFLQVKKLVIKRIIVYLAFKQKCVDYQ